MIEHGLALHIGPTNSASLAAAAGADVAVPVTKSGSPAKWVYVSAFVTATGAPAPFRARGHTTGGPTGETTVPYHPGFEGVVLNVGSESSVRVFNPTGAAASITISVAPLEWS